MANRQDNGGPEHAHEGTNSKNFPLNHTLDNLSLPSYMRTLQRLRVESQKVPYFKSIFLRARSLPSKASFSISSINVTFFVKKKEKFPLQTVNKTFGKCLKIKNEFLS